MEEKADLYLTDLWESMQDGFSDNRLRFEGALNLLRSLDIINSDKYELWTLRIQKCPDPSHIGNRIWCAYCGNVTSNE